MIYALYIKICDDTKLSGSRIYKIEGTLGERIRQHYNCSFKNALETSRRLQSIEKDIEIILGKLKYL